MTFDPQKLLIERKRLGVNFKSLMRDDKQKLIDSYIVSDELDDSTPVYRICHLRQLMTLLRNKVLLFKRPSLWDDPYESLFFKHAWLVDNQFHSSAGLGDNYYAQCWTLSNNSEGMWRAHIAVPGDGIYVQLESTVGRILEAMLGTISDEAFNTELPLLYAGNVEYVSQKDLESRMAKIMPMLLNSKGDSAESDNKLYFEMARTLFMKRDSFSHENEIRFVYDFLTADVEKSLYGACGQTSKQGVVYVHVPEAAKLLTRIEVDPWSGSYSREVLEGIVGKYSPGVPVIASDIYREFYKMPYAKA